MTKLIIAGSRNLSSDTVWNELSLACVRLSISEVVSGGCRGIDELGEKWATIHHIPCKIFKPDWNTYGKSAGPRRNKQMAEYADVLLLIWDGKSRGSANMKESMERLNKPIHEIIK